MTRQQAKKSWCPFSRAVVARGITGTAVNRHGDGEVHPACHCIADGCMAWRERGAGDGFGFCGLAGSKDFAP